MAADASGGFLAYHEPNIINILTLMSFFLFLVIAEWLADKIFRASLIGHIIVGLIYGVPLANILAQDWQETFLALGYIGLILIIFEGGLTVRLDLLRQNLVLSTMAALLGILTPIALSFALFSAGFHHSLLESFILGTALCSTSLGTTFVLLSSASSRTTTTTTTTTTTNDNNNNNTTTVEVVPGTGTGTVVDYAQTRIGTILISAALLDDVCGLVLVRVIHNLRGIIITTTTASPSNSGDNSSSLGWIIGRPVLASALMAVLTPAAARFVARPVWRRVVVQSRLAARVATTSSRGVLMVVMVLVLGAFLAIAAYAGASVLFGAFLAGAFLSALPEGKVKQEVGGMLGLDGDGDGEKNGAAVPEFTEVFDRYLRAPQRYVLQPLFFASIGFAIPFLELWTGEVIWKGVVYTLLMAVGKLIVGIVVPVWDVVSLSRRKMRGSQKALDGRKTNIGWAPATLLGAAMVARGEIGLLIIQIGLNETTFLTRKGFVIGVWAIVLNTIIGPVLVGVLLKRAGPGITNDARWGVQSQGRL
ncbi:Sodium/hydrogen exchanger family-domain-containing protein [Chaetomium strumarium]|uniref:Sodium/hydrogen exchanger family-domain-containing protein n=1 Tax=Chaetomium strumarium TaxID=1170767 RepID=A0AAJ0M2I3_9PEZI|nr:Sodium/hydrogen exchanger family-domain-containing protein [Chaetomium strumarium]